MILSVYSKRKLNKLFQFSLRNQRLLFVLIQNVYPLGESYFEGL